MHVNYLERLDDIAEMTRCCADTDFDGIEPRGYDRTARRSLQDYLEIS